MRHHERWFVGVCIERGGEPGELRLAEQAGRRQSLVERIQHEPVGPLGCHD